MTAAPVTLCILDGWGDREDRKGNAVRMARTPTFDALRESWPSAQLVTSGTAVGLPDGQMGNSEVGHLNIGAGRVVEQTLPRIDRAIEQNVIADEPHFKALVAALKKSGGTAQVLGLVSDGGVHSHQSHLIHLVNLLKAEGLPVRIHAFADGRDTAPDGFAAFLKTVETDTGEVVSTVIGRYYAMDRDKRWDRTERAYELLVAGQGGETIFDSQTFVTGQYAAGKTDEFLEPGARGDYTGMADGDALVVANFRADRVRQLLGALVEPDFDRFKRSAAPAFVAALGLTQYSDALSGAMEALFPPQQLTKVLGDVVAEAGLRQVRAAETEKYPHVTYFLNGGREEPFDGEVRIMEPSPKVATYDLKPEMSARPLVSKVIEQLVETRPALTVLNFANPDMVGHTGDLRAAVKAVETVDACLGHLWEAMDSLGGTLVVIADHGNCEEMVQADGSAHTAHTTNLVPIIVCGTAGALSSGRLADVAPTLLSLMGLEQPAEMTGVSLLES